MYTGTGMDILAYNIGGHRGKLWNVVFLGYRLLSILMLFLLETFIERDDGLYSAVCNDYSVKYGTATKMSDRRRASGELCLVLKSKH